MTDVRPRPLLFRYAVLAAADLAAKAMGFAVSLAVIRRFGPEGFGEISFAAAVVTYALMMGTCGMDVYAVRSVASASGAAGPLAGTVIALRLLLGCAAYLLLLGLGRLVPSLQGISVLLGFFGLSLFTSAVSLAWVPEALQRTHVLALANLGTQSLWLALVLGALARDWGLWAVPAAQVAAEGLVAAGLLAWALAVVGRPRLSLPWRRWGDVLRQSAPIGGAKVMRTVALGSDLVLLGFLVSREELGWYAGAYKLFLLCISLGALYFVILLPRLARRAGTPELRQELRSSLGRVLPLALAGAALLAACSTWLLQTIFGPSFGVAALSFRVLLLAVLANLVASHFRNVLLVQGRQRLDFCLVSVSSLAHVALKLLLITALGIDGAAFGTFLGEAALAGLTWWAVRTRMGSLQEAGSSGPTEPQDSRLNAVSV